MFFGLVPPTVAVRVPPRPDTASAGRTGEAQVGACPQLVQTTGLSLYASPSSN